MRTFADDFKFTGGKYKEKWLSEISDISYIEYCLNNYKLKEKNKELFQKRLRDLQEKEIIKGLA